MSNQQERSLTSTEGPDQKGLVALTDLILHYQQRGSRFVSLVDTLLKAKDLATNLESTEEHPR